MSDSSVKYAESVGYETAWRLHFAGIRLAQDNLPVEHGAYQFVYGPRVPVSDLWEMVFSDWSEVRWGATWPKLEQWGPFYRETREWSVGTPGAPAQLAVEKPTRELLIDTRIVNSKGTVIEALTVSGLDSLHTLVRLCAKLDLRVQVTWNESKEAS